MATLSTRITVEASPVIMWAALIDPDSEIRSGPWSVLSSVTGMATGTLILSVQPTLPPVLPPLFITSWGIMSVSKNPLSDETSLPQISAPSVLFGRGRCVRSASMVSPRGMESASPDGVSVSVQ